MRFALAALVLAVASPSYAASMVQCTASEQKSVTITLNSQRTMGRTLSCISGSFIEDMTPCAPSGAWSLSAPTGTAAIVGFADRWQEYSNHEGGVVGFTENPQLLRFEGFFQFDKQHDENAWMFDVNRLSGKAYLKIGKNVDIPYVCEKVVPKF